MDETHVDCSRIGIARAATRRCSFFKRERSLCGNETTRLTRKGKRSRPVAARAELTHWERRPRGNPMVNTQGEDAFFDRQMQPSQRGTSEII
eukprot:9134130-Pyramimonas_sp.AAC.1